MGGGGKETFAMTDVTPNEARMPEDAAVTVTNADTLRAMASPIRMRILGTLRVNGEQTVGSISEQLGEAPGAISYHLGQLARVGLVEKVRSPDGDRRKSWWKACQTAVRLGNSEEKNSADKAQRPWICFGVRRHFPTRWPTSVFWTGCRNCLGNGPIHAPATIMF